jgi:signal transduction histidine kinase
VFSSAGLGLAICQRLVAAQGGTLAVASAPDAGTRFGFELELPPAYG